MWREPLTAWRSTSRRGKKSEHLGPGVPGLLKCGLGLSLSSHRLPSVTSRQHL